MGGPFVLRYDTEMFFISKLDRNIVGPLLILQFMFSVENNF